MVLPKYEPNFTALTSEEAAHLASAMSLPDRDALSGHDIYEVANQLRLDQADVVMCLATDATVQGVSVVEKLIGKPIERRRSSAPSSRSPRGPRGPRVSVARTDPRVVVYVAPNPKKPGSSSWSRFEQYTVGETIDQFLARGGTLGDVKWDLERGFIQLGAPGTTIESSESVVEASEGQDV
jgi:hypothetical protein